MFHVKHSESREGARLPPAPRAPGRLALHSLLIVSATGTQNAPGSLSPVDEASD